MNKGLVITTLGERGFQLNAKAVAEFSARKVEALLVYLVVEKDTTHRRESLFTLLWPGMPESSGRNNLRQVLFNLRQVLPEVGSYEDENQVVPLLLTNRKSVRINPAADLDLDIHRLESLNRKVKYHSHTEVATCESCRADLEEAQAIYLGEFLQDFYLEDSNLFEEWAEANREKYRQIHLETLNLLAGILMGGGDFEQASKYIERQLVIDNLLENAHRQMMEVLALSGKRVEAIRQYHECARILEEELGISPSVETTQLHERISAGEILPGQPPAISEPPEPKMPPGTVHDFIGRADETAFLESLFKDPEVQKQVEEGWGEDWPVIQSYDPVLDREIRILFRLDAGWDDEERKCFVSKAREVVDFDHPNILKVLGAGKADLSKYPAICADKSRLQIVPFIVTDDIKGFNLRDYQPQQFKDLVAMARQVSSALEYAHAREIIHANLRPENVFIGSEGNVILADFGLQRIIDCDRSVEALNVEGIAYLAPETIRGQDCDFRVDLYALGVILYELATGERPFQADDPVALISQVLHAPLIPPRTKRAEVPPGLESLIKRLLRKDPADRPTSTREVRQLLEIPGLLLEMETQAVEQSMLDRIVRGGFVGRDAELEHIRVIWNKTLAGEGQTLLVSGEPGIGKSRLMREAAAQVVASGGVALIGTCYSEGNHPYEPIQQIIRETFRRNPAIHQHLDGYVMAELVQLVPGLQAAYPQIQENPRLEPLTQQQRLQESIVTLFRALSDWRPIMIALEDLHWSDSGTLAIFQTLARRTRRNRILLLGTYREVELDEAHPFNQILVDLNRQRLGTRIKLARLSQQETGKLLTMLFAEDTTPAFLEGIFNETEGNPFFIEEVCKALIENGSLYYENGRWQRPRMEAIEIPQSVRTAIQTRLVRLPDTARATLRLAAIQGQEFDFDALMCASNLGEDDLIEGIEIAEQAQMVEEVSSDYGGTFSFSHALIPATLTGSLSGLRRRKLHRQVAQAVEQIHPSAFPRLAFHWGEGGDDEKATAYTIKAADQAREHYANDDALQYYTQVLEILPESKARERFELLSKRAAVYALKGRNEFQLADAQSMLEVANGTGDDPLRCKALLALATYYWELDYERAFDLISQAQEIALSLEDALMNAQALMLLGRLYKRSLEYEKSLAACQSASDTFEEMGQLTEAAECLQQTAWLFDVLGEHQAAGAPTEKSLRLSRAAGNRQQEMKALSRLGTWYSPENYQEAIKYTQESLSIAREIGDKVAEYGAYNNLAIYLLRLGKLEESRQHSIQAIQLSGEIGLPGFFAINNYYVDYIAYTGEYQAGLAYLRAGMENARQEVNTPRVVSFLLPIYSILFDLGQYQAVIELLDAHWADFERTHGPQRGIETLSAKGLCTFLSGKREAGLEMMESACRQLQPDSPSVHYSRASIRLAYAKTFQETPSDWRAGLEIAQRAVAPFFESITRIDVKSLYLSTVSCLQRKLGEVDSSLAASTDMILTLAKGEDYQWRELFYLTHSQALRAAGREEEADHFLEKAYKRVMLVAKKTTDETLRRSWMENVPYNREILAEAMARGIEA